MEPETQDGPVTSQEFAQAAQQRLLEQNEVISSQDTELEQSFAAARQGVRQAQQASAARIESQFGRERGYLERDAQAGFTDFAERRSGFGTQMAAFRRLVETTDKNLNDLEQRKQELILQGESDAASKIAGLQVNELEMRQQAQQQMFNNILGLSQFGLQSTTANEAMQMERKKFTESVRQFDASQDQQKFNNVISLLELNESQAQNEFERGIATERLNIARQELAIQNQRLALQRSEAENANLIAPSEGFATYGVESAVRGAVADTMSVINSRLAAGEITEDEAMAQKLAAYENLRVRVPGNAVTDEALLATFGLNASESAEASNPLDDRDMASFNDYLRGRAEPIFSGTENTTPVRFVRTERETQEDPVFGMSGFEVDLGSLGL